MAGWAFSCGRATSSALIRRARSRFTWCQARSIMKFKRHRILIAHVISVLCLGLLGMGRAATGQATAGLTVTGVVGTVYSIEYITDLAQTNNPSGMARPGVSATAH